MVRLVWQKDRMDDRHVRVILTVQTCSTLVALLSCNASLNLCTSRSHVYSTHVLQRKSTKYKCTFMWRFDLNMCIVFIERNSAYQQSTNTSMRRLDPSMYLGFIERNSARMKNSHHMVFSSDTDSSQIVGVILHITLVSDFCKRNHCQTKAFHFAIVIGEEHIFYRNG